MARVAEARKGEAFAHAALRFMTGVQTSFDIPDEPLKRPETSSGPWCLPHRGASFPADVNMARAGVVARKALLDYPARRALPEFRTGLGFGYSIARAPCRRRRPGSPTRSSLRRHRGPRPRVGPRFLPKQARITQAEAQLEEARALERYALGASRSRSRTRTPPSSRRRRGGKLGPREAPARSVGSRARRTRSTSHARRALPHRAAPRVRLCARDHAQALMDSTSRCRARARDGWDASRPGPEICRHGATAPDTRPQREIFICQQAPRGARERPKMGIRQCSSEGRTRADPKKSCAHILASRRRGGSFFFRASPGARGQREDREDARFHHLEVAEREVDSASRSACAAATSSRLVPRPSK